LRQDKSRLMSIREIFRGLLLVGASLTQSVREWGWSSLQRGELGDPLARPLLVRTVQPITIVKMKISQEEIGKRFGNLDYSAVSRERDRLREREYNWIEV
jgi:hypothetical protein